MTTENGVYPEFKINIFPREQRYFLLGKPPFADEKELTGEQRSVVEEFRPVIDVFGKIIDSSKNNNGLGETAPATIRYNLEKSEIYLCYSNFAEGRETDHFGDMISARKRNSGFVVDNRIFTSGKGIKETVEKKANSLKRSKN